MPLLSCAVFALAAALLFFCFFLRFCLPMIAPGSPPKRKPFAALHIAYNLCLVFGGPLIGLVSKPLPSKLAPGAVANLGVPCPNNVLGFGLLPTRFPPDPDPGFPPLSANDCRCAWILATPALAMRPIADPDPPPLHINHRHQVRYW